MGTTTGLVTISGPTGTVEIDTYTCPHCNRLIHVTPRTPTVYQTETPGFCSCCMKPVCARCAGQGCAPFFRHLAEEEARAQARRWISEEA